MFVAAVDSRPILALLLTYRADVQVPEEVTSKNQGFVRLYFPFSKIHSMVAQRLAEFSNDLFQNVLRRRSDGTIAN